MTEVRGRGLDGDDLGPAGGAELREANLTEADLRGAGLGGVDLAVATLKGTRLDLAGAVLLAELHGAVVDVAED